MVWKFNCLLWTCLQFARGLGHHDDWEAIVWRFQWRRSSVCSAHHHCDGIVVQQIGQENKRVYGIIAAWNSRKLGKRIFRTCQFGLFACRQRFRCGRALLQRIDANCWIAIVSSWSFNCANVELCLQQNLRVSRLPLVRASLSCRNKLQSATVLWHSTCLDCLCNLNNKAILNCIEFIFFNSSTVLLNVFRQFFEFFNCSTFLFETVFRQNYVDFDIFSCSTFLWNCSSTNWSGYGGGWNQ